ncbi:hypothetical protein CLAFUW4_06209 [Fulvia fulva]|uniref:Uncharacterized protein n=1 Tax=Passalora fulva TaxID=5499 RepID=A0A9Q8P966_PASFU|nr:uncharacterized protein CLAFUR5_06353 [Fulvia fulva]KAK4623966.1 hypothetical protein CLAFUR4_06212 [Fulvia fulva]KAK4624848.1 hypothetical protein CLAFUR0_06216 [Fulvia fulva]UJO17732.1 hypothetical protein CLAFUR5_06353 [Fulvia fulva]WPV15139.1 hypothetical protein CLAFUW4_06209 [Fulvia fulva]WPV30532.1 hypothetical protein CLAFUW7_06205 [Fulvia fulva]
MAEPPQRASLLGLPRELRLQIYQHVFDIDLHHKVLLQWRDTHTAEHGFKSVPDLNHGDKLTIPWLQLMLTCRTAAVELRALMQESSFLEQHNNGTYTLDLEATRGGMTLGPTTWRHIPCAPSQVQCLEAYYNASRGFQAWGVGGPHGITSGLYQTLNHFVHCGPRFDSERMLPKPSHLKELRVIVVEREFRGEDENPSYGLSERDTDPRTTLYALGSIVGQIVRTGVLKGFVDDIHLSCDGEVLNWSPSIEDGEGIPEYWNRYGFDWGMALYEKA